MHTCTKAHVEELLQGSFSQRSITTRTSFERSNERIVVPIPSRNRKNRRTEGPLRFHRIMPEIRGNNHRHRTTLSPITVQPNSTSFHSILCHWVQLDSSRFNRNRGYHGVSVSVPVVVHRQELRVWTPESSSRPRGILFGVWFRRNGLFFLSHLGGPQAFLPLLRSLVLGECRIDARGRDEIVVGSPTSVSVPGHNTNTGRCRGRCFVGRSEPVSRSLKGFLGRVPGFWICLPNNRNTTVTGVCARTATHGISRCVCVSVCVCARARVYRIAHSEWQIDCCRCCCCGFEQSL
mmetsp:Transcript_5507/g.11647  ORF Transcript_5507/g.11647 Transcript_5507/m.11647 type:complete len:292 (+) Transcript_5507:1523-2398(+)